MFGGMTIIRISPRVQITGMYLLACTWNAIWLTGRVLGKEASSHSVIWGILFLFIPPVFLYLWLRFAVLERPFVKNHPIIYFGAIGLAALPWICVCILVLMLRP